jgi:hypothetical protein
MVMLNGLSKVIFKVAALAWVDTIARPMATAAEDTMLQAPRFDVLLTDRFVITLLAPSPNATGTE